VELMGANPDGLQYSTASFPLKKEAVEYRRPSGLGLCHLQIKSVSMGQLLYSEDHLCRLRRTKDQVLNLEEHCV
jgi:hypothetical protein